VLYRRPSAAYFSAAGFRISLKGRGEKDRFPAGSDHAGDGCKAYGHTDVLRGCHGHFQRQGPCDQSHRKFCILCAEPETGALVQSGRAV